MKIAIITTVFKPELSGVAETVNKRVREISRIGGHEILVLAPDYGPLRHILPELEPWLGRVYENVRVETYPATGYGPLVVEKPDTRRILPFWKYAIDPPLERFAPDVIHVDEPERLFGMRGLDGHGRRVGLRYARKHRLPITCMWHTDYIKYASLYLPPLQARIALPLGTRLVAWVYGSYDVAICNSREALAALRGIGVRNARYLPSVGIDLDNFRPFSVPRGDDALELLYVGRVTPEKSLPVLLSAFEILEQRHPRLRLRIVGDGPSLAELRQKHARPRVRFDGRVENETLPAVYNSADIFINPSHTETFTQTALEAAACGLPIVVAAGGGNFETVREGFNGEFFAPGSVDGLVDKIELLIGEPERRRAYASRSRSLAEPFGVSIVAQSFLDLWCELRERQNHRGIPILSRLARLAGRGSAGPAA